ncbi:hypothetical protein TNCV_4018481 [Trichonephila clavipes]|nr:hypothetical protein TNCV_4018481 [Trichonephila clavipes]
MEDFEWHRRFREGRESVKDDEYSGSPQTFRTSENVDKFSAVVPGGTTAYQLRHRIVIHQVASMEAKIDANLAL